MSELKTPQGRIINPSTGTHPFGKIKTFAATLLTVGTLQAGGPVGVVPGQILVQPKAHVNEKAVQALFANHGANEGRAIHQINVRILNVPEERQDVILEALRHNPNIEFAEPNVLFAPDAIPNDPYFSQAWHLPIISAPAAWDYTIGSSAVTVAILDSGIYSAHPDLAGLLVAGWNFYNNNSDVTDVNGHGTAVSGVVSALSNNGVGVAGVTWNCRIMPLRISDANGSADMAAVASALIWAADRGARVANISYGSVSKFSTVTAAAQYFQSKGGVVTASAGNSGIVDNTADNPYFLLVSATDENDAVCTWSNTGKNVDLAAPGQNIVTTSRQGGYAWGSGTSFAAPIVAGVAALVISANPNLTGAQVQEVLKANADDFAPAGWDSKYGWGRVNAVRAVAAVNGGPAPDTIPPVTSILSPGAGSAVSGIVTVNVSASDNRGVTRVELFVDGVFYQSSGSASALFSWDSRSAINGAHTFVAKAFDAAGNVGTSVSVSVTVNNTSADTIPPTAVLSNPVNGATVSGVVTIGASSSDNVGVVTTELLVDGVVVGSFSGASASLAWNSATVANGSHSITARARDAAGNSGVSAPASVTVNNVAADVIAPKVQITSPKPGDSVAKNIKISVGATDETGVDRVELYINGTFYQSSVGAAATFTWNTAKISKGDHTLQAFAFDPAGNKGISTVVKVTK